jgi:hypothetical protein
MGQDNPGTNAASETGDKPSTDHDRIASAIDGLRKCYESGQGDRADHDRKTLFWGRLTGVGVAVYTLLTLVIAGAAIYSSAQSKITADATVSAAETAIDNEQRSLRAYVMVESSVIGINSDGKPDINITTRNFGLTPAYDFQHWACAVVRDFPDKDTEFLPAAALVGSLTAPKSVIAPHATIGKVYAGACDQGPMSTEQIAAIRGGTKTIFAIGVMKYRDAFNADWITEYRRGWDQVHGGVDGYGGNCADQACPK